MAKKTVAKKTAAQKPINKRDLLRETAEAQGVTITQAGNIVDTFLGKLAAAVRHDGARVRIKGLGSVSRKHVAARMGRNPATNKPVKIPAKSRISIRADKAFKDNAGL